MGPQSQHVGVFADGREGGLGEHLRGHQALTRREIQFHILDKPGKIVHHQDAFFLMTTQKSQDLGILRQEELDGPPAQGLVPLSQGNHALHPPQQGMGIILLGFHIDGLVMVFRVDVDGEIESLGVRLGKAGVAVGAPLHGRAHPVPVSQKDIIPHADFIAVVEDRSPGHGKEEGFHQFDAAAVISQQGRQATANSQIDAGPGDPGSKPGTCNPAPRRSPSPG